MHQGPYPAPSNSTDCITLQQESLQSPPTQKSHHNTRPNKRAWKAGYYTSLKSQKRIKYAASSTRRQLPARERAGHVLKTFLSIPPERCNAANLVCALTLSAQVLASGDGSNRQQRQQQSPNEFRSLLYQTLDILKSQLMMNHSLSARQLCNAAWAIAKHADRDEQLLLSNVEESLLSSQHQQQQQQPSITLSTATGLTETWDLRQSSLVDANGKNCNPAQRVDALIDDMALQLTLKLEQDSQAAKEGELCMACWAYGVLRRRRKPAGWKQEPRLGQLPNSLTRSVATSKNKKPTSSTAQQQNNVGYDDNLIRFEQLYPDAPEKSMDFAEPSPADILFDKVSQTLLEPLEPSPKHDDNAPLRLEACKWNELANLAWAFASHGRACSTYSQELMLEVARESTRRLRLGKNGNNNPLSRDVAQIVWSLGTLQSDNFRLADGLVELVDAIASEWVNSPGVHQRRPFADWSCADLVQVALSLAHSRLDDPELLRALYAEAGRRLSPDFSPESMSSKHRKTLLSWEISILLWTQARLYLTDQQDEVFARFAADAVSILRGAIGKDESIESLGIGPQEQANIAWSLTVLELYKLPEAKQLLRTIFQSVADACQKNGVIQLEHAHQLWQAFFILEGECPECCETVPRWFRDGLYEKWSLEKARTKISSARHKSLSNLLHLMGVSHYNEHDEDIDVAIVLKPQASWTHETQSAAINSTGKRVAVEFDGPNHFTRQALRDSKNKEPPRTLGHTVLKYRLLKRQGWTVIRVPYYEFDRIPFWASMERQRYLQRLLKTHCNLRFSDMDVSEYKAPIWNRKSRFD